ncbi:uncharacterized protein LOC131213158 isoform X2 [Anopheles bellator]|uniref:uncharacterized protein LOC131213158 isoform X2 n=1 Tax=Anopheles bellator TaxID=139047 RepID=UPI0026483D4F|nr:uncharacterized protein LOC131213158 isoform X2 [Anopheles bellator]
MSSGSKSQPNVGSDRATELSQSLPYSVASLFPLSPHYTAPDCVKDEDGLRWEAPRNDLTPNTTPVSTVLHSPEPTTTAELELKMRFQHRHQIQVGRSPVGSGGHNGSSDSTAASSPVLTAKGELYGYDSYQHHQQEHRSEYTMLSAGEVVVFDDIEANWPVTCGSEDELPVLLDMQKSSSARERNPMMPDDGRTKGQTIIGGLMIAEYEGSPRRFGSIYTDDYPQPDGLILYKTTGNLPRPPGFPKRVNSAASLALNCDDDCDSHVEDTNDVSNINRQRLIDLEIGESSLYNAVNVKGTQSNETAFNGQTKYYSQAQQPQQIEQDNDKQGSNLKLHDFALSPVTDYESGCRADFNLHSSLTGVVNNYENTKTYDTAVSDTNHRVSKEHIGAPCTEYGRMCNSMPILEDGLSSGHASDSESNTHLNGVLATAETQSYGAKEFNEANVSYVGMSSADANVANAHVREVTDIASLNPTSSASDVQRALNDIRLTLRKTKTLPLLEHRCGSEKDDMLGSNCDASPIWVLRSLVETEKESNKQASLHKTSIHRTNAGDDEETDTDLETDRLLGHQQNFSDSQFTEQQHVNNCGSIAKSPPLVPTLANIKRNHTALRADTGAYIPGDIPIDSLPEIESKGRHKTREVLIEGVLFRARYLGSTQLVCEGQPTKSTRMMQAEEAVTRIKAPEGESQPSTEVDLFISTEKIMVLNTDLKEIMMDHALRTISYIADIGQLVVLMARRRFVAHDAPHTGAMAAAVAPSETPPHTDEAQNCPEDSSTTTRMIESPKKRTPSSFDNVGARSNRTPKMICHVFESEEAQFIAQSIGQAFQVAYMEFLKANGIEDHSFMKELDYQEVLNSQEIFGDELEVFAKKELQKEVVVPKTKGEILGVVIVESGWGSMLPTVVIANLASSGAAARCGQLNIGDQIIAINGLSLVGLPLSTCQNYIKNTKNQTAVKFTVVPCAPVVEVKIKRPNTKYQLGFSVQNGVICSLLRGGIAERGGVRVGHRIIEINNQSVVAVSHEKIVKLLATSVGEILMKTMPTSMFRLLTGQENPIYI